MLTTIGFITIVTAAITSTFVEAARRRPRERANKPKPAVTAMAVRFDEIKGTLRILVEQTRPR
jgi:hypothetical protein